MPNLAPSLPPPICYTPDMVAVINAKATSSSETSVTWKTRDTRFCVSHVDPFGDILVADDSDGSGTVSENPFRFSTKYHDDETGLVHFGLRCYSRELARWTSRDPIHEAGGENLYGFVRTDPINKLDSLGLEVEVLPADVDSFKKPGGWTADIERMYGVSEELLDKRIAAYHKALMGIDAGLRRGTTGSDALQAIYRCLAQAKDVKVTIRIGMAAGAGETRPWQYLSDPQKPISIRLSARFNSTLPFYDEHLADLGQTLSHELVHVAEALSVQRKHRCSCLGDPNMRALIAQIKSRAGGVSPGATDKYGTFPIYRSTASKTIGFDIPDRRSDAKTQDILKISDFLGWWLWKGTKPLK